MRASIVLGFVFISLKNNHINAKVNTKVVVEYRCRQSVSILIMPFMFRAQHIQHVSVEYMCNADSPYQYMPFIFSTPCTLVQIFKEKLNTGAK